MLSSRDKRRRILGTRFLGAAALQLALGQTLLKTGLSERPLLYLAYWSFCFLFVLAAVSAALLDLVCIQRMARHKKEALVKDIKSDLNRQDDTPDRS